MTQSDEPVASVNVAIVGGGPAGMALALALHRQGVAATVFDARPRAAARDDPRVLALSYGSRLILEELGIWNDIEATPIDTIHVSQQGGLGRTRLSAEEQGVPALGYVAAAGNVAEVLDRRLAACRIDVRDRSRVTGVDVAGDYARVHLDNGQSISSRLIAWAEGSIADVNATIRDYRQHALICRAETSQPVRGTAYERFTPQGPLALLPTGNAWSAVYTVAADMVQSMLALDDQGFLARLQEHFGSRLEFIRVGPRGAYPLVLRVRRDAVAARQVWIGNAAQSLHPVAGQGFNLALRDVHNLARCVGSDDKDCGSRATLGRYVRARRLDRSSVIGFTDLLVRLFSNDCGPLRHARGLGLLALDVLPPARSFVAKRMMFGARAWP
jgi:2-octaprenyl-6-methoxyphenol hydroxylase